jgi:predicted transcriptional regulator
MKLQVIIEKLSLNVLTNVDDKDVRGVFISDMLSDVMSIAQTGNIWITVQTHKNIVSAANLIDVSAVIVTHNKKVPAETIELANRFHVTILSTSLSTFDITRKLIEIGIS